MSLKRRVNPPPTPDRWAAALRAERLSRGLSQREFAAVIGLDAYASNVSNIEAGRRASGARSRARIEAALGKPLLAGGGS
jgi:transcriptional regulator with XRE-family HTH domain